jgi:hypothetical protein
VFASSLWYLTVSKGIWGFVLDGEGINGKAQRPLIEDVCSALTTSVSFVGPLLDE